jgi:hypothetical protein
MTHYLIGVKKMIWVLVLELGMYDLDLLSLVVRYILQENDWEGFERDYLAKSSLFLVNIWSKQV